MTPESEWFGVVLKTASEVVCSLAVVTLQALPCSSHPSQKKEETRLRHIFQNTCTSHWPFWFYLGVDGIRRQLEKKKKQNKILHSKTTAGSPLIKRYHFFRVSIRLVSVKELLLQRNRYFLITDLRCSSLHSSRSASAIRRALTFTNRRTTSSVSSLLQKQVDIATHSHLTSKSIKLKPALSYTDHFWQTSPFG